MTTPNSPFSPHPDDENRSNTGQTPPPPPHQNYNHQAPLPSYVQRPQAQDPYAAQPGQFSQFGQPAQSGQPNPYAQPGQYPAPPYGSGNPTGKNWANIVSLVTGILLCFPFAFVAAIIFGHIGVNAAKKGEATNKGLGIAGLVLGYFGLVLSIIGVAFQIWMVAECANNPTSMWCDDF